MAHVTVHIEGYSTGSSEPGIVVDHYEGDVHLDFRRLDDTAGTATISPAEARALAAVLLHAAASEVTVP